MTTDTELQAEIDMIRSKLTLPLIDAISKDSMPECFAASRAMTVALAQMLMICMQQNQALIEAATGGRPAQSH